MCLGIGLDEGQAYPEEVHMYCFAVCFNIVKGIEKSGVEELEELRLANALFNEVKVHPREDEGRKIRLYQCWVVLRDLLEFDYLN